MHASRRILAIIAGISLLPLLGILLTALLAGVLGCEVNESGPTPCMAFGTDIGDWLSGFLTLGWFGLLTIPFLMVLVAVWALVEAYVWGRQRRKTRRSARGSNA
ncbi:MAG: hypothetical protein ABL893_05665 [Hyphomicrobium sp.]